MKNINQIGIPLTLILMVAKLSFVNYKSFIYLYTFIGNPEQVFAIVGAIAFSMVTVLVMQNKVIRWPKTVFPFFDAGLVFIGFNIHHYDEILNGTDNPFRFTLTIFMSVFAGLITYSLGLIRYETGESNEQKKADEYKQKWYASNKEAEALKGKLNGKLVRLKSYQEQLEELKLQHAKMQAVYLSAERSRIRKKKPQNRTSEEKIMLETKDVQLTPIQIAYAEMAVKQILK